MVPMPRRLGAWHQVPSYHEVIRRQEDLGTTTRVAPHYTDEQQHTLQIIAIVFSSISVASALVTFYWFRRMRRSFRHDLIMFLIQSDMFKALWFLVYPIVVFVNGPVTSASPFCVANGFLVALGIEASDFAVLMIALHSALYIFNTENRSASGEGGLYPYRHVAFVCWIIFPVLMASLAFINDQPYVNAGTYCYLPVRPFWYRLALSWVPRYLIFAIILLVYIAIYVYVHFKFRDFGSDGTLGEGTDGPEFKTVARKHGRHSVPHTPQLAYNGLISNTGSRRDSVPNSLRDPAMTRSSYDAIRDDCQSPMRLDTANSTTRLFWTKDPRNESDSSGETTLRPEALHPVDIDIPAHPVPLPQPIRCARESSSSSDWSAFMTSSRTRRSSLSFFAILHTKPQHAHTPESSQMSSIASTPVNELRLTNSRGSNFAVSELQKTRERIRRQLRFMFIYPLVYITMWIVPFVSHVLQYQDKYALNPPYALIAVALIFINSQCAVDAWLFSTREKPWKQIPETNGGFWESLCFWEASWGLPNAIQKRKTGNPGTGGKSRAEMTIDAKRAYRRRDAEIAEAAREKSGSKPCTPGLQRTQTTRDWWETSLQPLATDGTVERNWIGRPSVVQMSPVIEEVGPFDHAPQSISSLEDKRTAKVDRSPDLQSDSSAQVDLHVRSTESIPPILFNEVNVTPGNTDKLPESGITRHDFVNSVSNR